LFIQTDVSVVPFSLVLSALSNAAVGAERAVGLVGGSIVGDHGRICSVRAFQLVILRSSERT
jgi:hypothetical protein